MDLLYSHQRNSSQTITGVFMGTGQHLGDDVKAKAEEAVKGAAPARQGSESADKGGSAHPVDTNSREQAAKVHGTHPETKAEQAAKAAAQGMKYSAEAVVEHATAPNTPNAKAPDTLSRNL
jgi:hypothetical protein